MNELLKTWLALSAAHPSCADEALRQISTTTPDGIRKPQEEYLGDLVWACRGIIACGGEHGA